MKRIWRSQDWSTATGWISKPPCQAALSVWRISLWWHMPSPRSVGAYYPEANVLVPLDYLDKESGTPSYKSVPVRLTLRSKEIRPL